MSVSTLDLLIKTQKWRKNFFSDNNIIAIHFR